MQANIGKKIYGLCKTLWPITRSITGDGVRETLSIIKKILPFIELDSTYKISIPKKISYSFKVYGYNMAIMKAL